MSRRSGTCRTESLLTGSRAKTSAPAPSRCSCALARRHSFPWCASWTLRQSLIDLLVSDLNIARPLFWLTAHTFSSREQAQLPLLCSQGTCS